MQYLSHSDLSEVFSSSRAFICHASVVVDSGVESQIPIPGGRKLKYEDSPGAYTVFTFRGNTINNN